MPTADDEIALAAASAARLGVKVGDPLPATGSRGEATLTVTGIGFVPHSGTTYYDEGAWLSPGGYDRLVEGFAFHVGLIALRPGADPSAVLARLAQAIAEGSGADPADVQLSMPEQVVEAAQLRNVEALPRLMAGFVALLAVAAVGHALAAAVRRRRHDVAVLRALGMTRGQSRGVVLTQACVLAVVGLALGIPLGLALGRTLWRVVADATPLLYVPPVAGAALALIAPLVLVVATLLAALPGQRAARLPLGQVLRAE